MFKNIHPIASIFNIFHPGYPRIIRVIDFTIAIYLKLFFTFLPLTLIENEQLLEVVNTRPVSKRDFKGVNDLDLRIKEVNKIFMINLDT